MLQKDVSWLVRCVISLLHKQNASNQIETLTDPITLNFLSNACGLVSFGRQKIDDLLTFQAETPSAEPNLAMQTPQLKIRMSGQNAESVDKKDY